MLASAMLLQQCNKVNSTLPMIYQTTSVTQFAVVKFAAQDRAVNKQPAIKNCSTMFIKIAAQVSTATECPMLLSISPAEQTLAKAKNPLLDPDPISSHPFATFPTLTWLAMLVLPAVVMPVHCTVQAF